jgi:lysophospholipase L1-like esterase
MTKQKLVLFLGIFVFALSPVCFSQEGLKDGEIQVFSTKEGQGVVFTQAQAKNRYIGDFIRWAQQDIGHIPAPKDSWLFIGSSSMRMWRTIKKDLAPLPIIHRGFGGSTIWDVMTYKDFFARYKAMNIVVYEGDNDLNTTDLAKADKFLKSCREFIDFIHKAQPETMIYFISPKPSISRWSRNATYEKGREGLKAIAAENSKVKYIDVASEMLGSDGKPKKDIFLRDKLHMNSKGYKIWTAVVRKELGLKEKVDETVVKVSGEAPGDGSLLSLNFGETVNQGGWYSVSNDTMTTRFTGVGGKGEISVKFTSNFSGVNKHGAKTTKKVLGIPQKVSAFSLWGSKDNKKAVFEISGLDNSKKYQLTFFASRMGAKDNRETTYDIAGASAVKTSLDAANNTDHVAQATGVMPTEEGKITITVTKGEKNTNKSGYYYLNSLKIAQE